MVAGDWAKFNRGYDQRWPATRFFPNSFAKPAYFRCPQFIFSDTHFYIRVLSFPSTTDRLVHFTPSWRDRSMVFSWLPQVLPNRPGANRRCRNRRRRWRPELELLENRL